MLRTFPLEFRRDVVAVTRQSDAPFSQVARDFGVSESCLQRWLKFDDVEEGRRHGLNSSQSAHLRGGQQADPGHPSGSVVESELYLS